MNRSNARGAPSLEDAEEKEEEEAEAEQEILKSQYPSIFVLYSHWMIHMCKYPPPHHM
jgi:hypothetical protein